MPNLNHPSVKTVIKQLLLSDRDLGVDGLKRELN